jgi:hypothetical protein
MRSCSSLVLMQQPAEQVTPVHLDWMILGDDPWTGWVWGLKPQRPVRAMPVVVLDIDAEDPIKVPSPDDQQPVQALDADGPHPAFGIGVRVGRLDWRAQHLGTHGAEHVIEGAAELRVAVADQQVHPSSPLVEHQQQVACLLGDPGAVRVGGDAGQVHPAGVQLDEEQHIQPPKPDGVDGEEVAGDDPRGLLAQERRQLVVARRGAGSSPWLRSVVRIAVAETCTPTRSISPLMR